MSDIIHFTHKRDSEWSIREISVDKSNKLKESFNWIQKPIPGNDSLNLYNKKYRSLYTIVLVETLGGKPVISPISETALVGESHEDCGQRCLTEECGFKLKNGEKLIQLSPSKQWICGKNKKVASYIVKARQLEPLSEVMKYVPGRDGRNKTIIYPIGTKDDLENLLRSERKLQETRGSSALEENILGFVIIPVQKLIDIIKITEDEMRSFVSKKAYYNEINRLQKSLKNLKENDYSTKEAIKKSIKDKINNYQERFKSTVLVYPQLKTFFKIDFTEDVDCIPISRMLYTLQTKKKNCWGVNLGIWSQSRT